MAGTVTITEERLGTVKKVTFAWTSAVGGAADGTTAYPYTGRIQSVVTVPGTAGVTPDDNYDVVLLDGDSIDVGNGQLINRSQTLTQTVSASLGNIVGDTLTLGVTNAGDANSGMVIVYIGQADDGSAVQASIGSPVNTGGAATLAAILGDPANVALATSIAKLDGAATLGLAGTSNSLAYRVHEIERHLHSYEKWFGVAATPSATHKADRVGQGIVAFELDGGNLVFGSWVQILGSDDTTEKYDLHKLFITDVQETAPYFVQLAFGAVANDAVTAGTFTEFVFRVNATNSDRTEIPINCRRQAAGTLGWARCLALGTNTGTMSFYFGLHTYEG